MLSVEVEHRVAAFDVVGTEADDSKVVVKPILDNHDLLGGGRVIMTISEEVAISGDASGGMSIGEGDSLWICLVSSKRWGNVEEGADIQKGDLIAKVRVVPNEQALTSAKGRVNKAQLQLDNAKIVYERNQKLFQNGVISKKEMETFLEEYGGFLKHANIPSDISANDIRRERLDEKYEL